MPKAAKRRNKSPNKPPKATNGSWSTRPTTKQDALKGLLRERRDLPRAGGSNPYKLMSNKLNSTAQRCSSATHQHPWSCSISRLPAGSDQLPEKERGPRSAQNEQEPEPKEYRENTTPTVFPLNIYSSSLHSLQTATV